MNNTNTPSTPPHLRPQSSNPVVLQRMRSSESKSQTGFRIGQKVSVLNLDQIPEASPTRYSMETAGGPRGPSADEEFKPAFCGAPKNASKLNVLVGLTILSFVLSAGIWNFILSSRELNFDGLSAAQTESIKQNGWIPVGLIVSITFSFIFNCIYTVYYESEDAAFYQTLYETRQRRAVFMEQKKAAQNQATE